MAYSDPYPRKRMVPGRVAPIDRKGRGLGTAKYGDSAPPGPNFPKRKPPPAKSPFAQMFAQGQGGRRPGGRAAIGGGGVNTGISIGGPGMPGPGPNLPGGGGGGGGGGSGGGGGNRLDWRSILERFGVPLDPSFLAQRRSLNDTLNAALTGARNNYNVGTSQAGLQNTLAQQSIMEQMAARGITGSGIQNRDMRYQGNANADALLGLQNSLTGSRTAAFGEFNAGLMEALMDLIRRQSAAPGLNVPTGRRGR